MAFDINAFLQSGALIALNRETLLVGLGEKKWLKEPTDLSFFSPSFFLAEERPWFEHEQMLEMPLSELAQALSGLKASFAPPMRTWQSTPRSSFCQSVDDLKKAFEQKTLVKAVPYAKEHSAGAFCRDQLIHSLKHVIAYAVEFPVHLYGFWGEDAGMLGATPEILFSLQQGTLLQTMACAGTRARGPDEGLIAKDLKELYEHRLVVQDIATSLSPYGELSIGTQQVRPFNRLVHLVTPIHLKMEKPVAFAQIVHAMHPTAALGAIPREAGREWLCAFAENIEPRGRFGAPVGYIKGRDGACLVGIRNMQWDKEGISLYAGCGVVPNSLAEREWDEIQLKLKSIKESLAL